MDTKAAITACALIALGVVAIVIGRIERRRTPRERRISNLHAATVMSVALICMSVAWPQMWGPVGSWTWVAVALFVLYGMVYRWYRFTKNADHLEEPVKAPGQLPDPPATSS